jgi:hypothetical protein
MTPKRSAIQSIFAQVGALDWAAPNLDALADVLRDLGWLPTGAVVLDWTPPARLAEADRLAIEALLRRSVQQSASGPRPITVRWPGTIAS